MVDKVKNILGAIELLYEALIKLLEMLSGKI